MQKVILALLLALTTATAVHAATAHKYLSSLNGSGGSGPIYAGTGRVEQCFSRCRTTNGVPSAACHLAIGSLTTSASATASWIESASGTFASTASGAADRLVIAVQYPVPATGVTWDFWERNNSGGGIYQPRFSSSYIYAWAVTGAIDTTCRYQYP